MLVKLTLGCVQATMNEEKFGKTLSTHFYGTCMAVGIIVTFHNFRT